VLQRDGWRRARDRSLLGPALHSAAGTSSAAASGNRAGSRAGVLELLLHAAGRLPARPASETARSETARSETARRLRAVRFCCPCLPRNRALILSSPEAAGRAAIARPLEPHLA